MGTPAQHDDACSAKRSLAEPHYERLSPREKAVWHYDQGDRIRERQPGPIAPLALSHYSTACRILLAAELRGEG